MQTKVQRSWLTYLFTFIILTTACNPEGGRVSTDSDPALNLSLGKSRSLSEVIDSGELRALVTYSSTSYFLYKGIPMGFEYELLKRYADHLGVSLKLRVSDNIDSLLPTLRKGEVDLVAHGLTITSNRKKQVAFTDYLYLSHQVLVQRKPDAWRNMSWGSLKKELVNDAIQLIGDTISVRAGSAYLERLHHLSDELGGTIHIDTLKGSLSTDKIIKMVVDGKVDYTVADNNLASINASFYPSLNIEVPISFSQRIAWATHPESPGLNHSINDWISMMKDSVDYYVIYNKYFKNKRRFRKQVKSDFYSLNRQQISIYDDMIQENAHRIGWDWRLLASVVYQESRFNPKAKSWVGAKGLMQMMPATAKSLNVVNRLDPEDNLRGGSEYLNQVWNKFSEVKDSVQRLKFAIASYNCGYGHVFDAQRLADKRGLNSKQWDSHVEKMILALSYPKNYTDDVVKYGYVRGVEPYTYVRQIFKRYEHYKQFIPLTDDAQSEVEEPMNQAFSQVIELKGSIVRG